MRDSGKYMVEILCRRCGELYKLKGKMRKGKLETGFKRCLCDNENDFEVRKDPII